jgi:hypothetical protein
MRVLETTWVFTDCAKSKEAKVAAFVFAKGVIPAKELAQAINEKMEGQSDKVTGSGDCLKINGRVVAVILQRTVPESVIFVDKIDNFPFIEAAREVTFLQEFKGIDS